MKPLLQHTILKLAILFALLTAVLGGSYLYAAWDTPDATPPGSNVPTPLNTGSVGQLKNAGLSLESLTVNGKVQIEDGTEGAGKVLTADAAGRASWQTLASGGSSLSPCADGNYLVYDAASASWTCSPAALQARVDACSSGQAIRSVNADGTVVCGSMPKSAICTYAGVDYSTGAACYQAPGIRSETGAAVNCSSSNPESYTYLHCQADGSWKVRHGCYDPPPSPPFPVCGT